jgi:hypothetical protein
MASIRVSKRALAGPGPPRAHTNDKNLHHEVASRTLVMQSCRIVGSPRSAVPSTAKLVRCRNLQRLDQLQQLARFVWLRQVVIEADCLSQKLVHALLIQAAYSYQ